MSAVFSLICVVVTASSSLGPLPLPFARHQLNFGRASMIKKDVLSRETGARMVESRDDVDCIECVLSDVLSAQLLLLRGGYADYVDDDDYNWDEEQPEPQNFQAQEQGQGQQNSHHNIPQSQPPWQHHWDQSQQYNYPSQNEDASASNGDNEFVQNDADDPPLPGEPSLPQYSPQGGPGMYGGNPQQHQRQKQTQQQRHQSYPHHQGQQRMPPPNHRGQQYPPQQYGPPLQQRRYPPPPNFPGYGPGNRPPSSSSKIHDAHEFPHDMPPPGFDEEFTDYNADAQEMMEDEDDLPPDGTGGIELPTTGSGQSSGGGMDLSQFDKDVIFSGLKRLYRKKIRPLELSSKYGHFHSPPLSPSDFDSKPMVLLLGQYSVGKTSFIRYLLGRDFPGQRIGPEPTTDRFVAIMKGDSGDKIVPGAALCSQADRPFRGLSPFGNNFLSRFEGVEMDSPILNNITLVDTPGILSGQKQSIGRNYDYEQVMKWFAERADLIIIMFDAHKLDISDELKRVIELLKPHQDKMRVLLNKADAISTQQLMRVYGALMWSLGKVMMTPEVCRVYMGSFWGAPLKNKEQAALLTQEKLDLFNDIAQLPQNAVMRRINELVKRARSVKVHAYIIHYLRKQLPYTWGKREKQRRLIDRLDREFVMCARRYELPRGDFPELEPFRQALLEIKDLSEVQKLDKKMVKEMDKVFSVDIPNLLEAAKYH